MEAGNIIKSIPDRRTTLRCNYHVTPTLLVIPAKNEGITIHVVYYYKCNYNIKNAFCQHNIEENDENL